MYHESYSGREPLRHALGDSEIRIRFYAARELQKLGDHAGTPVLVEAAGNDEAFPLDRVEAVQLLGLSGDARAVEPLKRIGGARISFQYPHSNLNLQQECDLALKQLGH